jgi:hypothetical protein
MLQDISVGEYEDILTFLDELEKGDKTLRVLFDEVDEKKVDKEDGKSLINAEHASAKSSIESPEFLDVTLDEEDKVIEGTKTDGVKVINTELELNSRLNHRGVITDVTANPEFIEAKVDSTGKLIEGINSNGEKIFGVIPPQIKQYIDENMPSGGGVSSIEYDAATGDMYATYDDESGVTDVYMEPNGDIYVEYEE